MSHVAHMNESCRTLCVAVCCSVLQCVAYEQKCNARNENAHTTSVYVAVCYSVLRCVAVSCGVLQCVAYERHCIATYNDGHTAGMYVAVCYGVLQCVAVCCLRECNFICECVYMYIHELCIYVHESRLYTNKYTLFQFTCAGYRHEGCTAYRQIKMRIHTVFFVCLSICVRVCVCACVCV